MGKIKICILRTAGMNCDRETFLAFKLAGGNPELLHINQLVQKKNTLKKFHIFVIPGGFTYGDDISAGKILANELRYKLFDGLSEFIQSDKLVIGICNGFQILIKAGFLPDFNRQIGKQANRQTVTLTFNDSAKFECRWVYLKKVLSPKSKVQSFWTENLPKIIQLPVAHGEGKFVAKDKKILDKLEKNEQVIFKYVDENGEKSGYPYNPNGSERDIAAICNKRGNIFGLMPHPERFILEYQYPLWTKNKDIVPFGLTIFKNAVEYAKNNF